MSLLVRYSNEFGSTEGFYSLLLGFSCEFSLNHGFFMFLNIFIKLFVSIKLKYIIWSALNLKCASTHIVELKTSIKMQEMTLSIRWSIRFAWQRSWCMSPRYVFNDPCICVKPHYRHNHNLSIKTTTKIGHICNYTNGNNTPIGTLHWLEEGSSTIVSSVCGILVNFRSG